MGLKLVDKDHKKGGQIQPETLYARRLLGHGRIWQLLKLVWCRRVGHKWTNWLMDWDADYEPRPQDELTWLRGCDRECGAVQTARATMLQRGGLPGGTRD